MAERHAETGGTGAAGPGEHTHARAHTHDVVLKHKRSGVKFQTKVKSVYRVLYSALMQGLGSL